MNIIDFGGSRCNHCYKCVRSCSVKAIDLLDSQAVVAADRCTLCGRCFTVCPQNAKTLRSDLSLAKRLVHSGRRTILSLDPSYLGLFSEFEPERAVGALCRLGFGQVRETAEGASNVTAEYVRLLQKGQMDNIISSACPSATAYIEMYYPELTACLAPVVSPMIAHAMQIKQLLGEDTAVVFATPCLAARAEARDARHAGLVDAVLDFDELALWMAEEGIRPESRPPVPFANPSPAANRLYPVTGGIIAAVEALSGGQDPYRKFYVDGDHNCRELCESMKRGEIHGCFIEMRMCTGSCVKGPLSRGRGGSRFKLRLDYEKLISQAPALQPAPAACRNAERLNLNKVFCNRAPRKPQPDEDDIREILQHTGKMKPSDELDCGACGYPTCRDMAAAVYQGRAEVSMCIPYMHDQAASLSNLVMETSPNIVIIVDRRLNVLEYSAIGEKYFGKNRTEALRMKISNFFDPENFLEVLTTRKNIHGRKVAYPQYDLITLQNIVYLPEQDGALATIIDITASEKRAKQEYERKLKTIDTAQKVIDKQMMVAQQIAGLLGETTAETKVSLTNIGRILLSEGEQDGAARTSAQQEAPLPFSEDKGAGKC